MVIAFAVAAVAAAQAPEPPSTPPEQPPLTLEEAERQALEASPALRASEARVRIEAGQGLQVRRYPNPDLTLDSLRFTRDFSPKETILSLRQPVPYHGKRALDRERTAALTEAARHDLERARLDLLLEVREGFYRLHYAAQVVEVQQDDLETVRSLSKAVEARVAEGDVAPFEALKATVEVRRAERELARARGDLAAQMASFNLLLGLPAETATRAAEPGLDLDPGAALPALQERALKHQPGILVEDELLLAAGFTAQRARREPRPDIAVGPTLGSEEGSRFVGIGVSLKLPVWDRNQGAIAAAEAARDEAAARAAAVRLAVARLVAESYGRYQSARSQQLLYEQGLLAQGTALVEAAQKSYDAGESGVLEFLDARRTSLAVRQGYYLATLEAALAALQLRRAVGEGGR